MTTDSARMRNGLIFGLSAYACWGILPVFFKLVSHVSPGEVVAQRMVWSLVFLSILITIGGRWRGIIAAARVPRTLLILFCSAVLIAGNWLVYVIAIIDGHVLAGSIGYFLNPLVNVALGVIFLRERLNRGQAVAVALAAAGVAVLAWGAGYGLLISLSLALTFGGYGLLRKIAPVEALEGLMIETAILAPFALGWLVWLWSTDALAIGSDAQTSALLSASGVFTAVPLLLFAAAARRMQYSTLGLLQYLAPTLQFLLAVFAYHEAVTRAHQISLALIWTGLIVYAVSTTLATRRAQVIEPV